VIRYGRYWKYILIPKLQNWFFSNLYDCTSILSQKDSLNKYILFRNYDELSSDYRDL
jgi:hypothetical protein